MQRIHRVGRAVQGKYRGQKAIHSICQLTELLYAAEYNERQSEGRLAEKVHFKDTDIHTSSTLT